MDFVFEEGEAVDIGAAGQHDFEFVEGESLTDNDKSTLAFVEGTGIGGVWRTLTTRPAGGNEAFVIIIGSTLYAFGGSDLQSDTQKYDIDTDTWTNLSPLPVANETGPIGEYNGKIYLGEGAEIGRFFEYDIATDSYTEVSSPPSRYIANNVASASEGSTLYTFASDSNQGGRKVPLQYDMASDTWSASPGDPDPVTPQISNQWDYPFGVRVNGDFHLFGGADVGTTTFLNFHYKYDGSSWTRLADLPTARNAGFAEVGADGRIYAIGGQEGSGSIGPVEAYDIGTDSWETGLPDMPVSKAGTTAHVNTERNGLLYVMAGTFLALDTNVF